ncbi:MAG: FeoA family protein [Clostridia bacterium]
MKKSLSDCKKNEVIIVKDINSLPSPIQRRLGAFGIYVSSSMQIIEMSILQKTVLLKVNKNIFALGKSIASQIFVEVKT